MARPNPRKLPSAPMAGAPAAQAEEALRLGKFKEAVELYKQLLKVGTLSPTLTSAGPRRCSPRGCSRRPRSF